MGSHSVPDITSVELKDPAPRSGYLVAVGARLLGRGGHPSTNDGAHLQAEARRLLHTVKANRRFSSSEAPEYGQVAKDHGLQEPYYAAGRLSR